MSMQAEKLRAAVAELERELRAIESVDDESRRVLQSTINEIHAALRRDQQAELKPSLVTRLKDAIGKFEASHPSFTKILSGVIDGLAEMGI
jgi:phytoene/squalene synthetase